MPRARTSGNDGKACPRKPRASKTRKTAADAKTGAEEAASPPEVTTARALVMLEEIRQKARSKGHSAAAVTAVLAMARLAGLFKDNPERSPAPAKFDGNYHEAARRIALLLRLGKEKPAKTRKAKATETS